MGNDYHRWKFSVPQAVEEIFIAELWSFGAMGLELLDLQDGKGQKLANRRMVEVYFPDPLPGALVELDWASWQRRGVERQKAERLPDQDWLADYRAGVDRLKVGQRFWIDSGDVAPEDSRRGAKPSPEPDGRWLLRIPAQTAFGTGTHESTRLAVSWLEDLDLNGQVVLDVGTGSGILAFAALLLGARRVVAYDLDDQSVCVARCNAAINGLNPTFYAGGPGALRSASNRFDLLVVNILPERIRADWQPLLSHLKPEGTVINSGNLVTQRDELVHRFADLGLRCVGERQENEWLALALRRSSAVD